MLEILPYNLRSSLRQPMPILELVRVASASFCKGYSRAKSEPGSNGKKMGEERGRELFLAPSLTGFSFDIVMYKTLTKNT